MFNEDGLNGDKLPANQWRYAAISNKCFGSIRFRQLRVTNTSCTNMFPVYGVKGNDTEKYDVGCYAEYDMNSPRTHSRVPFGKNNRFVYGDCEANGGGSLYYSKQNTYDCDGFSVFLPFSSSKANAIQFISDLKSDGWIDKQTRAILIEFFTYNPNINYFVQAKIVTDFTAGGGLGASWAFRVFKLDVLRTPVDYILFTLNLILPVFVLFKAYILIVSINTAYKRTPNWKVVSSIFTFWNILDLLNILMFCVSFILRLLFHIHPEKEKFQITNEGYPRLDNVAFIYVLDVYINSASVILSFLIFYKYFEVVEKFNLLIRTIEAAKWTLLSIGLILSITIIGFSISGYMMFGTKIENFRDVPNTVMTLLRVLLGDFDYNEIRDESRTYAGFYYLLFVCIGVFLVLNMFLAVISYYFSELVGEEKEKGDEGEYVMSLLKTAKENVESFLKGSINFFVDKFKKKKVLEADFSINYFSPNHFDHGDKDIVKKLDELQEKKGGDLTKDDLYLILGMDADPLIIEGIMKRFDQDGDGTISIDEIKFSLAKESNNEEDQDDLRKQEEEKIKKDKIRDASRKSINAKPYIQEEDMKIMIRRKLISLEKEMIEIVGLIEELNKSETKGVINEAK